MGMMEGWGRMRHDKAWGGGGRGVTWGGRINLECRGLIDPFVFITIMPTTLLTPGFNVSNGLSPTLASIVTSTFINCVRILVYFSTILWFFFCSVFCFFSFPLFGIILTSLLGKGMRWIDEKDWYFVVESVRISINISDIGFIRGYCEM